MVNSVCCHTRDFEYISEFIDHHLNLGFNRIVIYDNFSINPVKYDDPRVIIIRWEEPIIGLNTYNHYIKTYCEVEGWTAFIDEDEFIMINSDNITTALNEFSEYDALGINWKFFGDKIDADNASTKLTEKYLYHIPTADPNNINIHIKTICKNDKILSYRNPHYPFLKDGAVNKSVLGKVIPEAFSEEAVHEKIWINHYSLRGLDNFLYRKGPALKNSSERILANKSTEQILTSYYFQNNLATVKK